jgi:hypothetical protein
MLSPADRIVEATMCCTLRPKKNDREKVIAAALEFVIHEFQDYRQFGSYERVISCSDLWELIVELRNTVPLDQLAQGHSKTDLDAL